VESSGWIPVLLPDLGVDDARIVQWLVAVGGPVAVGDRIAEVLAGGVLIHLAAEAPGVLQKIDCGRGCRVREGEPLAWIEPAAE
jgi:pyruvate/2-oxoglutarate dehydrogenase complex dihydrolipoamide acyltransferase (E2) component